MKMLESVPVVARDTSCPPTTPRGSSCGAPPGRMTFMDARLLGPDGPPEREVVVQPLRATSADALVDRLGAQVVLGGLPGQVRRAVGHRMLAARGDQRVGEPRAARVLGDEQV